MAGVTASEFIAPAMREVYLAPRSGGAGFRPQRAAAIRSPLRVLRAGLPGLRGLAFLLLVKNRLDPLDALAFHQRVGRQRGRDRDQFDAA